MRLGTAVFWNARIKQFPALPALAVGGFVCVAAYQMVDDALHPYVPEIREPVQCADGNEYRYEYRCVSALWRQNWELRDELDALWPRIIKADDAGNTAEARGMAKYYVQQRDKLERIERALYPEKWARKDELNEFINREKE